MSLYFSLVTKRVINVAKKIGVFDILPELKKYFDRRLSSSFLYCSVFAMNETNPMLNFLVIWLV